MTLLVGVRCSDGIVLAADGATTMGSGTVGTTVVQSSKKISIVAPGAAIAVTGHVGLGQRLAGELGKPDLLSALASMEPWMAMSLLRQKFGAHLIEELNYAAAAIKVVGQAAMMNAIACSVVAVTVQGHGRLFQFDQQGAPEEANEKVPWLTLGSGQHSADAFFAFLRRVFWPNRLPTLSEGVFTALWTVMQGIESAPGGIGGSPQVVILDAQGQARELGDADLEEHRESIASAERALANFRASLAGTGNSGMPQP